jgi:hypothetical protein
VLDLPRLLSVWMQLLLLLLQDPSHRHLRLGGQISQMLHESPVLRFPESNKTGGRRSFHRREGARMGQYQGREFVHETPQGRAVGEKRGSRRHKGLQQLQANGFGALGRLVVAGPR